jgi:hypothetical protein
MNPPNRRERRTQEKAQGNGQPPPQVQIPITREVRFINCPLQIRKGPDGSRELVIIDPAANTSYIVPFTAEGAREMREAFTSVDVASAAEMPKVPPAA